MTFHGWQQGPSMSFSSRASPSWSSGPASEGRKVPIRASIRSTPPGSGSWEDLALLIRQRVDHLVLFGEAAGKMMQALAAIIPNGRPFTLTRCDNLFQAVRAAAEIVEPGDVVLMSPGGTSFDEFQDFEQRGEYFKQWVNALS